MHWWDFIDFPFDFGDDFLAGIVVVLAIAAFVVFMIFLGWPLLLLLIETLWGIAALVLGALARVLFRRPWSLVAETEGDKRVWHVRTWRAAKRAERIVLSAVRAGRPLPNAFPAAPIT